MPRAVTIGVYDWTRETFLAALAEADVRLLMDLRQRRGVRGRLYTWANSARLQRMLEEAGVGYEHRKELAPTTELRRVQYEEDARRGIGKRNRDELAVAYVERYKREILEPADLDAVVAAMPDDGAAALLCVEADPKACHRSLVAEELTQRHGVEIEHLRP